MCEACDPKVDNVAFVNFIITSLLWFHYSYMIVKPSVVLVSNKGEV